MPRWGRIIDQSADQESTDLQKCLARASAEIKADPGKLSGAGIFAAGSQHSYMHVILIGLHASVLHSSSLEKLIHIRKQDATMPSMCCWMQGRSAGDWITCCRT